MEIWHRKFASLIKCFQVFKTKENWVTAVVTAVLLLEKKISIFPKYTTWTFTEPSNSTCELVAQEHKSIYLKCSLNRYIHCRFGITQFRTTKESENSWENEEIFVYFFTWLWIKGEIVSGQYPGWKWLCEDVMVSEVNRLEKKILFMCEVWRNKKRNWTICTGNNSWGMINRRSLEIDGGLILFFICTPLSFLK